MSPVRPTRIPSTGNRARVMDVAQAFSEEMEREVPAPPEAATALVKELAVKQAAEAAKDEKDEKKAAETKAQEEEEEEDWAPPSVKNMVANWGPRAAAPPSAPEPAYEAASANGTATATPVATPRNTIMAPPMEKRKSSYERYSAYVMPPLQEERTPVASPAGTLKRDAAPDPRMFEEAAPQALEQALVAAGKAVVEVSAPVVVEAKPRLDEVVQLGMCSSLLCR